MEASQGNVTISVTVDNQSQTVSLAAASSENTVDVSVNEIFGTGVKSVEQTKVSTEDGGTNEFTCTLTNGVTSLFKVMNGNKGSQGEKGESGDKGEKGDTGTQITDVSVTSEGGLDVTVSDGTHFVTSSLKGDKGDQGEQGIQGIQGEKGEKGDKGDTGQQGEKGDTGEKGDKGDTGSQGEKGASVTSVNHLFALSSSYTTAPTSWSSTVQTPTATQPYLWAKLVTVITDGDTPRSEESDPFVMAQYFNGTAKKVTNDTVFELNGVQFTMSITSS